MESLTTASPLSQTGLIPRIYRRADCSHRATPASLPRATGRPYQGRMVQRSSPGLVSGLLRYHDEGDTRASLGR